jgi:hypothetical protein
MDTDTDTVIRHFIEKPDTWIHLNIFFLKNKLIRCHNRKIYVAVSYLLRRREKKEKREEKRLKERSEGPAHYGTT